MKNSQDQSLWAGHLTVKLQTRLQIPIIGTVLNLNSKPSRKSHVLFWEDSLAFNKYLLNIYPVPTTIQGSGDIAMNLSQNRSHHALLSLSTSWIPWHNSILFKSIKKDILLYPSKTKNSWFPGVMFYKAAANSETRTMDPCS